MTETTSLDLEQIRRQIGAWGDEDLAALEALIASERARRVGPPIAAIEAAAAEPDRIAAACDIATGRTPADPSAPGEHITGAKKDLNAKGRGPEWYRMVYRGGSWRYVSDERLPSGTYLASDRRATVRGEVYPGEIVAQHDRGQPVDLMYLVCRPDDQGTRLVDCAFRRRRDGDLAVTLPDGSEIVLPDPRRRP